MKMFWNRENRVMLWEYLILKSLRLNPTLHQTTPPPPTKGRTK